MPEGGFIGGFGIEEAVEAGHAEGREGEGKERQRWV